MTSTKGKCRFLLENGEQCSNPVKGTYQLCDKHIPKTIDDSTIYEVVSDHFKMELQLFWTRANFYLVIESGLVSLAITQISNATISTTLGIIGIALAIVWFLVTNGTAFWIERWREQVRRVDKEVNRFNSYSSVEILVAQNRLLSPTYITRFLPLLFIVFWVLLGVLWLLNLI